MHLIRHAEIASHRGDIEITQQGHKTAEELGRRLAAEITREERIAYGFAPTRRTRQTVDAIAAGLEGELRRRGKPFAVLGEPWEVFGLRNPDVYLAGIRVEMVSSAQAFAAQADVTRIGVEAVEEIPFFAEFLRAPDRMGYWVTHPAPPGEDADAVAERLLAFASSLSVLASDGELRLVGVTHSGPMRAFLRRYLLGYDPGEPEYVERIDLEVHAQGPPIAVFRERRQEIGVAPAASRTERRDEK